MIENSFSVDSKEKIKPEINKEQPKTIENQRNDIQKVYNFCYGYYKQYEKFPKLIKITNATKLNNKQLKIILEFLISKKKIKRRGTNYYFPNQKTTRKKKIISKNKTNIKTFILFTFMGIISTIAIILSIYYTTLFFLSRTDNVFVSFPLSFIMVGFSSTAFQIVILLKQNKKYLLSFIVFILWFIVLIFSMASTVAGLYNQSREKQIASTIENNDNTHLYYQELLNQENSLKVDIDEKIKERKRYVNILQEFDTDEKIKANEKQINKYRNTVYYLDRDIKRLKIKQNKIREEKKKLLSDNKNIKSIEKEDFFVWASMILKIKVFIIEFYLYVFPAIFIDIIAPLNFSVILFYKKKENLSKKVL